MQKFLSKTVIIMCMLIVIFMTQRVILSAGVSINADNKSISSSPKKQNFNKNTLKHTGNITNLRILPGTSVHQSELSIVISPVNSNVFLASANTHSEDDPEKEVYGTGVYWSEDAGFTWQGTNIPPTGVNGGDPAAVIDRNGYFYVGFMDGNYGQGIMRSIDGGQTWEYFQVANPTLPGNKLDKNHLIADNSLASPYQGNLYAAWGDYGQHEKIWVARSTNQGETWDNHQCISLDGQCNGVNLQVSPDGIIYAVWAKKGEKTENTIYFNKSLNGGVDWQGTEILMDNLNGIYFRNFLPYDIRVNSYPVMAVSQTTGHIYVVWTNVGIPGVNTGDPDIYLTKSTDQGVTWNTPVRVNDDTIDNGANQWFPWITIDQNTDIVYIVFYDGRNYIGEISAEITVAQSSDGGQSFQNQIVSPQSFEVRPIWSNYNGDYIGIAAVENKVIAAWNAQLPDEISQAWATLFHPKEVFVTQVRESGETLYNTNIGRWEGGPDFVDYLVPHSFDFYPGNTEVLKAWQEVTEAPEEKYHHWNETDNLINHWEFQVKISTRELISHFKETENGITIRNQLLSAPEEDGGIIEFKDPWLIDYADPNYEDHTRNRGMDEEGDDALQFNPVSSPFNPNTGSGSGSQYLGVFLNQQIQDGIYYSLNAPESQEFSVNGKLLTWYFYGWEKEGALLENENSNNTTVVFTSYNANVNALYKGHLASSTPNATANNNGFHLQPRPAGSYSGLQMVYEDGGQIYRTYQTGAEDWEPENRLSNGNENSINSEPAIYNLFNTDGNQGNEYAAVWNRYNNIMGEHQLVYYGLSSVPKGTKDATAIKDATASSELHPSVAGYAHNGLNTGVVAYKDNAGIQLWFSRDDHLHPVSSSTYADFPTLECRKMEEIAGKFTSYYQLAWQEDDGIHFRKFRREDDTGPVDTYGDIILNSGISLLSDNIKPAICQKIGDYTFSVWQGQYLHKAKFGIKAKVGDYSPAICFRQLTGENTWGPVEIFTMSGNSADNPVVTAWDNGSSYDVLIAWDLNGTTSYFRRINGNWDSFYGFYMEGKNPAVTVKDNIPYLACTESIQEPYRILNEQISTSAKKKEQLLPPHKRLLSLDFSNNKENRFDFPLAIEVGDLQYYNADSINLIYPEYKDTLVTVSNAFVYKQFNVEPGFTRLEIPVSIYLGSGKSFPQLKGDYLNFKIFNAKNGKELASIISISEDKLKSPLKEGIFYVDTFEIDLSAFQGQEIFLAGSTILELFSKWTQVAEVYELRPSEEAVNLKTGTTLAKTSALQTTELSEVSGITKFQLFNNYPNPFNPETNIAFILPKEVFVNLEIFDISGRKIKTLINSNYPSGLHQVKWNCKNDTGNLAPSGVYIYRIKAGKYTQSNKMILIR